MNYNISMLRSLHKTLDEALIEIAKGVVAIPDGGGATTGLAVVERAHLVAKSLELIRSHTLSRVAQSLEDGVKGCQEASRRGWRPPQQRKVAEGVAELAQALRRHIDRMIQGEAVLAVQLWPSWSSLERALDRSAPLPEALFDPDPQFGEVTFEAVEAGYLKDVAGGAADRLQQAMTLWAGADSASVATEAARKAQEVFDQMYALRHRKMHQTYWLAWRARLLLGVLGGGDELLAQKAQWGMELRQALVEMQKFAEDHKVFNPQRLVEVLTPLLISRWPEHLGAGHPILAELDRRLGLTEFWRAVDQVKDTQAQTQEALHRTHAHELRELVVHLERAVGTLFAEHRERDIKDVVQTGMALLAKRDWLPSPEAQPLFRAVQGVVDRVADKEKGRVLFDPSAQKELAAMLLLFEEIVSRPFPLSEEVKGRVLLQNQRLNAAWEHKAGALQAMPVMRWDERYKRQQVERSQIKVLDELRGNVAAVERVWDEAVRGDRPITATLVDEGVNRLRLVAAVLGMAQRPAGQRLAAFMAESMEHERQAPANTWEAVRQRLAPGLAGLGGYFEAWRNLSPDQIRWIEPSLTAAMGAEAAPLLERERVFIGGAPTAANTPALEDMVVIMGPALDEPEVEEDDENAYAGVLDAPAAPPIMSAPAVVETPASAPHAFEEVSLEDEPALPVEAAPSHASLEEANPSAIVTAEVVEEPVLEEAPASPVSEGEVSAPAPASVAPEPLASAPAAPALEAPEEPVEVLEQTPFEEAVEAVPVAQDVEPESIEAEEPLEVVSDPRSLGEQLRTDSVWDHPHEDDPEIVESFYEESAQILHELQIYRIAPQATPSEVLADWRRAFHTLRGSSRAAGYEAFGEVARWVEDTIDEHLDLPHNIRLPEWQRSLPALIVWFATALEDLDRSGASGAYLKAAQVWDVLSELKGPGAPASLEPEDEQPEESLPLDDDLDGLTVDAIVPTAVPQPPEMPSALHWDDEFHLDGAAAPVPHSEPLPDLPPLPAPAAPMEVEVPTPVHAPAVADGVEEEAWDRVFDALDALVSAAQTLGQALGEARHLSQAKRK